MVAAVICLISIDAWDRHVMSMDGGQARPAADSQEWAAGSAANRQRTPCCLTRRSRSEMRAAYLPVAGDSAKWIARHPKWPTASLSISFRPSC